MSWYYPKTQVHPRPLISFLPVNNNRTDIINENVKNDQPSKTKQNVAFLL